MLQDPVQRISDHVKAPSGSLLLIGACFSIVVSVYGAIWRGDRYLMLAAFGIMGFTDQPPDERPSGIFSRCASRGRRGRDFIWNGMVSWPHTSSWRWARWSAPLGRAWPAASVRRRSAASSYRRFTMAILLF